MNDSFRLWIHLYNNNNTKVGKPKTRKDDAIQHENCSATAPFKIKISYLLHNSTQCV